MAAKIIVMSDERALVLEKLLAAFAPIIDDIAQVNTVLLGLRLADGSSRTIKTIATTLEDSAPASPVPENTIPAGWSEEVVTFYEGEDCTEVTRTLLVKD